MTEEEFGEGYAAGVEQVRRDEVMRQMAEALEPFARIAEQLPTNTHDAEWLDGEGELQAGCYRRANAALAAYRQLKGGR